MHVYFNSYLIVKVQRHTGLAEPIASGRTKRNIMHRRIVTVKRA